MFLFYMPAMQAGALTAISVDGFPVVDFLDFHIGGYHWPAFNIADVAICTGIAIWIYASINTSSTQGEG